MGAEWPRTRHCLQHGKYLFLFFWDSDTLCSPGWPGTYCVVWPSPKFTVILLPWPPWVAGITGTSHHVQVFDIEHSKARCAGETDRRHRAWKPDLCTCTYSYTAMKWQRGEWLARGTFFFCLSFIDFKWRHHLSVRVYLCIAWYKFLLQNLPLDPWELKNKVQTPKVDCQSFPQPGNHLPSPLHPLPLLCLHWGSCSLPQYHSLWASVLCLGFCLVVHWFVGWFFAFGFCLALISGSHSC